MPTGYTSSIEDGISFEKFVLQCSRAFGALIMMRDEPTDAPIPDEFLPSDYHLKEAEKAKTKYHMLNYFSIDSAQERIKKEYEEAMKEWDDRVRHKLNLKLKYEQMLDKVRDWEPPTSEHYGLKEFMIQQITESIKWDCEIYEQYKPVLETNAVKWIDEQKAKHLKDLEYHEAEYAKEVDRSKNRTEWVRALKKSLNQDVLA